MEEKFIQLLLKLNSINQKLKGISAELDKVCTEIIDEDFDKLFMVEQMETVNFEDFE